MFLGIRDLENPSFIENLPIFRIVIRGKSTMFRAPTPIFL